MSNYSHWEAWQLLTNEITACFEKLRQDEEESEQSSASEESDTKNAISENIPMGIPAENQQWVQELLAKLQSWQCPDELNWCHINASDVALNVLNYQDFPVFCHVRVKLTIKAKDKILDVPFQSWIMSMVGTVTSCNPFTILANQLWPSSKLPLHHNSAHIILGLHSHQDTLMPWPCSPSGSLDPGLHSRYQTLTYSRTYQTPDFDPICMKYLGIDSR